MSEQYLYLDENEEEQEKLREAGIDAYKTMMGMVSPMLMGTVSSMSIFDEARFKSKPTDDAKEAMETLKILFEKDLIFQPKQGENK